MKILAYLSASGAQRTITKATLFKITTDDKTWKIRNKNMFLFLVLP